MNPENTDSEERILLKTKRDQFANEIRRKKNEDILNSKRMKSSAKENGLIVSELKELQWDLRLFKILADAFEKAMKETSVEKLEKALENIRKAVSCVEDPPIELLYQINILPDIARFLRKEHFGYPKVQTEAAWIIANVVSSDIKFTEYAVNELNVIDGMMTVLQSPDPDVKENAIWAIANIAGESPKYAEILLRKGIVGILIDMVEDQSLDYKFLNNITWVFANLTKGKPYPPFELVASLLPILERLICCNDEDVLSNILWTVEHLTESGDGPISCVMEMECIKEFVNLAKCEGDDCDKLRTPALRLLGNCLASDNAHEILLIENNIIPCLIKNLKSSKNLWKKDALWAFSNLLGCGSDIIEKVFSDPVVLQLLIEIFYTDKIDMKVEVMKCFFQASLSATSQQIEYMVKNDLIKLILHALTMKNETEILLDALHVLERVLTAGAKQAEMSKEKNESLIRVDLEGGTKIIERLQGHIDERVNTLVYKLIEEFFVAEEMI